MIKEIYGNALAQPRGYIVHGCNCVGAMGSGIAASVRSQYPEVYEYYILEHEDKGLHLGDVQFVKVAEEKYIVNAMTQYYCGTDKRYADYEAIAKCFETISAVILEHRKDNPECIIPLYFPLIGAGLAGGNWTIISTIIDNIVPDSIEKILVRYQQ